MHRTIIRIFFVCLGIYVVGISAMNIADSVLRHAWQNGITSGILLVIGVSFLVMGIRNTIVVPTRSRNHNLPPGYFPD